MTHSRYQETWNSSSNTTLHHKFSPKNASFLMNFFHHSLACLIFFANKRCAHIAYIPATFFQISRLKQCLTRLAAHPPVRGERRGARPLPSGAQRPFGHLPGRCHARPDRGTCRMWFLCRVFLSRRVNQLRIVPKNEQRVTSKPEVSLMNGKEIITTHGP